MEFKTVLYAAAILMPMLVSAAEYKDASGGTPGLNPENAAGQLQTTIPAGNPDGFVIPSPPAPESGTAQPAAAPGSAGEGSAKRIFSENNSRHKRIAEALGIGYPCAVEIKHIGIPTQKTEKLTFDDGKKREAVVVKSVGGTVGKVPGFLRKAYMGVVSLSKLDEMYHPVMIFRNGIEMNKKFKAAGLKVLEIVLADTKEMFIATKFTKGTDLVPVLRGISNGDADSLRAMRKLGLALAAAHRNNFCVGDLNTGNVMFVEGEPHFIDVDRASVGGVKGWDIAMLFYYAIIFDSAEPPAWAADAARSFLQGYLAGGGEKMDIKDALSKRYLAIMSVSMRPKHLAPIKAVRLEMKKAAGEDPAAEPDGDLGPAR